MSDDLIQADYFEFVGEVVQDQVRVDPLALSIGVVLPSYPRERLERLHEDEGVLVICLHLPLVDSVPDNPPNPTYALDIPLAAVGNMTVPTFTEVPKIPFMDRGVYAPAEMQICAILVRLYKS